jgi:broad specificity polyphosphatase/5'/3'-nucleotidase SurE
MQLESYEMPTLLLTNDDGIQSIGLIALKKRRLERLGNVLVVAPRDEWSGHPHLRESEEGRSWDNASLIVAYINPTKT